MAVSRLANRLSGSDGMAKVLDCDIRRDQRNNTVGMTIFRRDHLAVLGGAAFPEPKAHKASLPSFFGDPFVIASAAMSDRLVREDNKSKGRAKCSF